MVASSGMRLVRELRSPLAPALALMAGAIFFGGGAGDSSLPWLGGAALLVALGLLATRTPPNGLRVLVPLALLAVWCLASVEWSIEPDRSWSYGNRLLVYLAFALVGALLGVESQRLMLGLCALLGAVCAWSLLGKVFPFLYEDYGRIARLRGPVGYWNSLALLGDIALPLGLCLASRWRLPGTLLVFGWLVAIGLTYSRGGIVVAVVVVAAWIVFSGAWLDALTTLLAAGIPAAGVLAVAFALPGLTSDGESHSARVRAGLVLAGALLADGAVAAWLARLEPPPVATALLRRVGLIAAVLACVAAVVVAATHGRTWWDSFTSSSNVELTNSPSRLTEAGSNFRWVWWTEAWRGFVHNPVKGTGAGTFQLTNERYRASNLDEPLEPHDVGVQFLSETGIVGLALLIVSIGWLIVASRRRPGPQLALALALPAFFLHSLIDIDWDFAAVAAPVFLVAGALAVRPGGRRRMTRFSLLAVGGLGLALFGSLIALWLANRWTNEAFALAGTNNSRALTLVRQARALDPFSIQPLLAGGLAEAFIAASLPAGQDRDQILSAELGFLQRATTLEPQNAQGWYSLGAFNLSDGCPRAALRALNQATILDGKNLQNKLYGAALAKVNTGRYNC